jgi:hypothetical protein
MLSVTYGQLDYYTIGTSIQQAKHAKPSLAHIGDDPAA